MHACIPISTLNIQLSLHYLSYLTSVCDLSVIWFCGDDVIPFWQYHLKRFGFICAKMSWFAWCANTSLVCSSSQFVLAMVVLVVEANPVHYYTSSNIQVRLCARGNHVVRYDPIAYSTHARQKRIHPRTHKHKHTNSTTASRTIAHCNFFRELLRLIFTIRARHHARLLMRLGRNFDAVHAAFWLQEEIRAPPQPHSAKSIGFICKLTLS